MRKRMYYVIYFERLNKDSGEMETVSHSRTRDRTDSSKTLDGLLKAGVRAWVQKEYE